MVTPTPAGVPDPPLPFTGGRFPASDEERRHVERRILAQYILAPALSAAFLLGGFNLGWPRVTALGAMALALTAVASGWLAIRERRVHFIRGGTLGPAQQRQRYFIYEGAAAVPFGLALVTGGAALGLLAVRVLTGTRVDQIRAGMLARPYQALVPLGACLLCTGLAFVIGFRRPAASAGDRFWIEVQHLPATLGALILLAWAATLLGIGLVEWASPALFSSGFERVFGNPWPFR